MRDFELTYGAYGEFQRLMERYWCLRWLQQNAIQEIDATVRREQLVKLDHLPFLARIPSAPADLQPGQRLRLVLENIDLLGPEAELRFVELLTAPAACPVEEDAEESPA